jgi:ABC-2 type transport system ATP-binding protein
MSGLDPIGRHLVVDLIRRYHLKGKTILFCSHILTDVERICDRIGIMEAGQLKAIIAASDLDRGGDGKTDGSESVTPLERLFLDMVTEKAA